MLGWDDATRRVLARFVPNLELIVDDLTRVPEEQLLRRDMRPLGKVVFWAIRAARVGFEPRLLDAWAAELNAAEADAPSEAFAHLLRYLLGIDEGVGILDALRETQLSDEVREAVMGYQQIWLEEGRVEGRVETLSLQLEERFGPLSGELRERLQRASIAQLDAWARRVLSAPSLEDLLDG